MFGNDAHMSHVWKSEYPEQAEVSSVWDWSVARDGDFHGDSHGDFRVIPIIPIGSNRCFIHLYLNLAEWQ